MTEEAYDDDPDPHYERYLQLLREVRAELDLPHTEDDADEPPRRMEVGGFDVVIDHLQHDPQAIYLLFDYGVATAGRTLAVFRLMLEANLLVYAQDQAQLGLDPETGSAQLIVRVLMDDDVEGPWLCDTLQHYAEHGNYWRENLLRAPDEVFEGLGQGQFMWLKV